MDKVTNRTICCKSIRIPRWIGVTQKDIVLHGLCDSSEKAYACMCYSRVTDENGQTKITLIAAKTRVVPLTQKTTLPRLELCAAVLLSQLMEKIKKSLCEHNLTVYAWSDSKVVLAWLQGNTTKWERYVANRVTQILKIIPAEQWHYVKSDQNCRLRY